MHTTPLSPVSACQLWYVDLDQNADDKARGALSEDENRRAARFVFERDRRRFRAAHLALRTTLSALSNIPADALAFETGTYGKPRLSRPGELHFNLSHSGGAGLIACHPHHEVGVDVEQVRPLSYSPTLAEAHFSAAERRQLDDTPPQGRDRAFLVGWTRKEACLKAAGLGLGAIEASAVDTGVTGESKWIDIAADGRTLRMQVHSFDCGADLVCAVARVVPAGARP